jgi:SAM-dependent methyltransferase
MAAQNSDALGPDPAPDPEREIRSMSLGEDQTRLVARDWKPTNAYANAYYDMAEQALDRFWHSKSKFRQLFDRLNKNTVVELACGRGRHTAYILNDLNLRNEIERIYLLDVNDENISFCKNRFDANILTDIQTNDGLDFRPIESTSVTSIFCYDAMVHFEYDAVQSYVKDAHRILIPDGQALFHHSNYDRSPGTYNSSNPHGRNFMSKNLFAHIAIRAGFEIREQLLIDWDDFRNLDCISLIQKRGENDDLRSVASSRSRLSGRIFHKLILRKMREYLSTSAW